MPALIDASITKSRQTKLEALSTPFYNKTDNVDFRTIFSKEFKSVFEEQESLPNAKFVVTSRAITYGTMKQLEAKLSPTEGLMPIRIWYDFSNDAKNIIVTSGIYIGTNGKEEPIYRNVIFYVSKAAELAEGESPFSWWSENNGQRIKEVYKDSASQIARLLVEDLAAPPSIEEIKNSGSNVETTRVTIPHAAPFFITPLNGAINLVENGYIIDENDIGKAVRGTSGVLHWIAK